MDVWDGIPKGGTPVSFPKVGTKWGDSEGKTWTLIVCKADGSDVRLKSELGTETAVLMERNPLAQLLREYEPIEETL